MENLDHPSQAGEAERADESGDELDFRQEELDCFTGISEGDDELEPVIRTKKRKRQSTGLVFCS